jgi:hypothetical protein
MLVCLLELQTSAGIANIRDAHLNNWDWASSKIKQPPFEISSKQAYGLLHKTELNTALFNKWWCIQDTKAQWKTRYKQLWASNLPPRGKIFLWRILVNRLYTNERALKLHHGDRMCDLCPTFMETPSHLFFNCLYTKHVWFRMIEYYKLSHSDNIFVNLTTFVDLLGHCLGMNC